MVNFGGADWIFNFTILAGRYGGVWKAEAVIASEVKPFRLRGNNRYRAACFNKNWIKKKMENMFYRSCYCSHAIVSFLQAGLPFLGVLSNKNGWHLRGTTWTMGMLGHASRGCVCASHILVFFFLITFSECTCNCGRHMVFVNYKCSGASR